MKSGFTVLVSRYSRRAAPNRLFLFAVSLLGTVSCMRAESCGPSAGTSTTMARSSPEPAMAPSATKSDVGPSGTATRDGGRSSRPRPNCERPPEGDGNDVAIAGVAATDASAAVSSSDAERVVASLRPRFRACYRSGLRFDPELEGCVVIRAGVEQDGSVASTKAVVADGLPPEVIACIARVVRNAHFNAPGASGATVNIPVTFIQEDQQLPKSPPLAPPGPQPTGAVPARSPGFASG